MTGQLPDRLRCNASLGEIGQTGVAEVVDPDMALDPRPFHRLLEDLPDIGHRPEGLLSASLPIDPYLRGEDVPACRQEATIGRSMPPGTESWGASRWTAAGHGLIPSCGQTGPRNDENLADSGLQTKAGLAAQVRFRRRGLRQRIGPFRRDAWLAGPGLHGHDVDAGLGN